MSPDEAHAIVDSMYDAAFDEAVLRMMASGTRAQSAALVFRSQRVSQVHAVGFRSACACAQRLACSRSRFRVGPVAPLQVCVLPSRLGKFRAALRSARVRFGVKDLPRLRFAVHAL